ncbi:MAG: sensor histidine kinase, partial [Tepidisphaerales bacterium]
IEQRARGRQVRIDAEFAPDLPAVLANGGEMQQVFLNLLLNALDAMPDGGVLTIRGLRNGEYVEVAVGDTGTGIAPDMRGRIFEPFVSTKEEGRGTGLGLSICLGLVRSHGGEIALESELGRGSRFTVGLPAVRPADGSGGRKDQQE